MSEFKAWYDQTVEERCKMQSFVEQPLPDNPIALGESLYEANGYLARCLYLLAESQAHLDVARGQAVVKVKQDWPKLAADERKICIEAMVVMEHKGIMTALERK